MLLWVAVISLCSLFLMKISSLCIDASTLSSILETSQLPSFLDTYNLPILSLEWKALCIINSFLVPYIICLWSSLIHFKNSTDYLTRGTTEVFFNAILAVELAFRKLSRSSEVVCFCLFHGVCFQYFPFLRVFRFFLDVAILFLMLFPTSQDGHGTFSTPNFISLSWLNILIIWIIISSYFLFSKIAWCRLWTIGD